MIRPIDFWEERAGVTIRLQIADGHPTSWPTGPLPMQITIIALIIVPVHLLPHSDHGSISGAGELTLGSYAPLVSLNLGSRRGD